jgi:pimeloyl-ACP methyl ester carboxylesterase
MAEDKFVTVNGLRLHYLDHGGAGRPHLVCVHGLTGNAHNFDPLAPHLARTYHLLAVDVRGRGDSAWGPPAEYLPQNYVGDLAAMLDALGIARVTLVGTSMGGIISIMYAGGWPERVERLVLNDIGPEIDPAGAVRIAAYVGESPERFKDLGEVAAYYRENYPPMAKMPEDELRAAVQWSVKPAPDGNGLRWKMDPAVRRPLRSPSQQRLDLWVSYARIACPILIVRGAESDILSRETTARMRQVHSSTRVAEVPGVGHAPSLVERESLAAMREFLGT